MNDTGMIAFSFLSSQSETRFFNQKKTQFRLLKDLNSSKMNDFLIDRSVPVTLDSYMLTFGDSNKS